MITGDWIDNVSHIMGKFHGFIKDDGTVTQGTWWATNIYAQGTWDGRFDFGRGIMSGNWYGTPSKMGWLSGNRE